jgi:hypothetical protein
MSAWALVFWAGVALAGDKDADGVDNKTDACPLAAEDVDGFDDADGCPDTNNDGDALDDANDQCPDEPEDVDGFKDDDGCPDPDNDNDMVPDADDLCAHESEDGEGAADGCPEVDFDRLARAGWMQSVDDLMSGVFAATAKQAEGCSEGAAHVQAWMAKHDPTIEQQVFEAQLARRPSYLEEATFRSLLTGKGSSYPNLKKALDIFCEENAAWQAAAPKLHEVMKPWMPPAP